MAVLVSHWANPNFRLLEIGSISDPESTVKISAKALVTIKFYDNGFILSDFEGFIYMVNQNFEVTIKAKLHKGALTTIDWLPTDQTVFLTGGQDYFLRLRLALLLENNVLHGKLE